MLLLGIVPLCNLAHHLFHPIVIKTRDTHRAKPLPHGRTRVFFPREKKVKRSENFWNSNQNDRTRGREGGARGRCGTSIYRTTQSQRAKKKLLRVSFFFSFLSSFSLRRALICDNELRPTRIISNENLLTLILGRI